MVSSALPLFAQRQNDTAAVQFSLHGYLKEMPSVSFINPADSVSVLNLLHNRMKALLQIKGGWVFRAELRTRLFYGEQVEKMPGWADDLDKDEGLLDLSFVPVNNGKALLQLHADRLYSAWSNDKWDITVGRQRINWGMHNIWNPNDIFNAYNYLDFDYEERPGSDAVRVQYSPKEMTNLDLAWRIGKSKYDHTAAFMYRFNMQAFDVQVLSGIMKSNAVLGAGFAGNAGNAGVKGEMTWFHPFAHVPDSLDAFSFTAGVDYSSKNNWMFNGSYLFQTTGSNSTDLYALQLLQAGTAKNLMPFRHSLFALAAKTINPLLVVSVSAIYAPGGRNYFIFFPSVTWQFAGNWDVSMFAQSMWGNQGQYKSMGNAIYLRLKWNF